MQRLALFISGGGTTATAIVNACKADSGSEIAGIVKPVLVVSSRRDAKGIGRVLETGQLAPADVKVIRPRDFESAAAFGEELIRHCAERDVNLFGQYGWAVHTPKNFIARFHRGVNQHPCVLSPGNPDFGGPKMLGRTCHAARLLFVRMTNRDFWTRAVAQRVDPEYDKGAILRQENVEILPSDDVDTLAARVLPVEHRVQIQTLADFAHARVTEIPGEEIVRPHEMYAWCLACEMAKLAYPKS